MWYEDFDDALPMRVKAVFVNTLEGAPHLHPLTVMALHSANTEPLISLTSLPLIVIVTCI